MIFCENVLIYFLYTAVFARMLKNVENSVETVNLPFNKWIFIFLTSKKTQKR